MDYWKRHSEQALVSGDEVLVTSVESVGIYDGEKKTQWRRGKASLSTHNIFYQPSGNASSVFRLALEDMRRSGESPTLVNGFLLSSDKIVLPLPGGKYTKLSFKQGSASAFFDRMATVLQAAAWRRVRAADTERPPASGSPTAGPATKADPGPRTANMIGIAGVMKASADSSKMQGTFKDIDDVMGKASSLVEGIRHLRQRSGTTVDEAMELETIEATLGLGTLVTASGSSSAKQAKFHSELGTELHGWMTHSSNAKRFGEMPVLPLIEVFALYNKARGGDLVSPEDVLLACKAMTRESYSHYSLEELSSGAMVLVHKDRSIILAKMATVMGPRVVNARSPNTGLSSEEKTLSRSVKPSKSVPSVQKLPATSTELAAITEIQLASTLLISVPTAKDVLEQLQKDGYLCSSDAGFGCSTYYWNIFVL